MAPEYGATMGYFPIDERTIDYLNLTGRNAKDVNMIENYLREQGMFASGQPDPEFSGDIMHLDLGSVEASLSGPKRPHDRVTFKNMKKDFNECMTNKVGFKGFGLDVPATKKSRDFVYEGKTYTFNHGDLVIAAITSCTNTSNPDVMMAAGLLAKNAVKKGLMTKPYIKKSLSPGSHVVTDYYKAAGVEEYMDALGFTTAGYGCMTCIGNSGEIPDNLQDAIIEGDMVASAVLSGNRNFEGRVHPHTRANYLASPPLVIAYALAGSVDFDFDTQSLGNDQQGNPVFLKDIWPTRDEVLEVTNSVIKPEMFKNTYETILKGSEMWQALEAPTGTNYDWDDKSTYIHNPPFFQKTTNDPQPIDSISGAHCLINMGDSITTDHISPAGKIAKGSPAARYLSERGIADKDFNSYGSRRGNDEIMARGTFANVRLINKMVSKVGPTTVHVPSGKEMPIFDAAETYQKDGIDTILLAGKEYGSGSSRDWAAKGPFLQGVKAVVAQSYERIHRSNLVGMGILPLQFKDGENADSFGLNGSEKFSIDTQGGELKTGQDVEVKTSCGKTFTVTCRLDTDPEVAYFQNGGILNYVLRKLKN